MTIDCKNLDCPKPVLLVKDAYESLADDDFLDVELNSYSSIENVKRFATKKAIYFEIKSKTKEQTVITLVKGYKCEIKQAKKDKSFLVIFASSILSALIASTCCLAPFLFLVFGVSVSSLSFLQIFAPYSVYFSVVSATLVLYLWYDYFKRRRKKLVCETWLSKNYVLLLGFGTIVVAILTTYPYWVNYLLE